MSFDGGGTHDGSGRLQWQQIGMRSGRETNRWLCLGLLCASASLASASCGMSGKATSAFSGLRGLFVEELVLDVTVSPDANGGSPVAVDVVVVYDQMLMDKLVQMSATDWFEQRDQFRRDFPQALDVWQWEWVPGQKVERQRLPIQARRSKGGLVFANYALPGTHRARIDLRKPVSLSLGEDSFSVGGPARLSQMVQPKEVRWSR